MPLSVQKKSGRTVKSGKIFTLPRKHLYFYTGLVSCSAIFIVDGDADTISPYRARGGAQRAYTGYFRFFFSCGIFFRLLGSAFFDHFAQKCPSWVGGRPAEAFFIKNQKIFFWLLIKKASAGRPPTHDGHFWAK